MSIIEVFVEKEEIRLPRRHLREKGGFEARKKRGEAIKSDMENIRVIRELKREQRERSEEPVLDFMFNPFYY